MARRSRTVLTEAAASGPDFAGHFTVVTWGCGTSCQTVAIIDETTGRVTVARDAATADVLYDARSALLVMSPRQNLDLDPETGRGCDQLAWQTTSRYYKWDGTQLRHLIDIDWCSGKRGKRAG